MATFILMWKPDAWIWHDLSRTAAAIQSGEPVERSWSVGRSKNIPTGSRAFILRLGHDRPGFMASGWVSAAPTPGAHWDETRAAAGDQTNYITVTLDVLLDPAEDPPMDWRAVASTDLAGALRHLQGSGKSIPSAAAAELESLWADFTRQRPSIGESDHGPEEWVEGAIRWSYIKHRSRERSLRRAKIAAALQQGPLRCEVPGCGFDFEGCYGGIGRGFAHVHHLRPLGSLDGEQSVSLDDLAIVCANCHAMIHRGGECRALDTLVPATKKIHT